MDTDGPDRDGRDGHGPPEPGLEHAFDLHVEIDDPIEVGETGDGARRIIPITGGTVTGVVEGEVLPAGADFQLFRQDRPIEVVAKYAFETDAGERVYVENEGIAVVSPSNDPGDVESGDEQAGGSPAVYFRTVPRFETASEDLRWLAERVFVASAHREGRVVHVAVYGVT